MPSLSVHLLIGLSFFLLCYFTSRDLLASFLSLICAVIPDADALFGVHRCFIVHNFLEPILLLILSTIFRFARRYRAANLSLWAGLGYLSHIFFDMFTWYVAVLYPILDICVWTKVLVDYSGKLNINLHLSLSTAPCSSLPTRVPYMTDKILIPVAVFVLLIVVVSALYARARGSRNSACQSKKG